MKKNNGWEKIEAAAVISVILFSCFIILRPSQVKADSYTK